MWGETAPGWKHGAQDLLCPASQWECGAWFGSVPLHGVHMQLPRLACHRGKPYAMEPAAFATLCCREDPGTLWGAPHNAARLAQPCSLLLRWNPGLCTWWQGAGPGLASSCGAPLLWHTALSRSQELYVRWGKPCMMEREQPGPAPCCHMQLLEESEAVRHWGAPPV